MIPSVLSQHVEQGVKDFLRNTFPVTTIGCCDREKYYKVIWVEFEQRFNESGVEGQA